MPMVCGELTAMSRPTGGGVHVTETVYTNVYSDGTTDQTTKQDWYKSRMVFPLFRVGNTTLEKVFVAGDPLGVEIANGIHLGEKVCLYSMDTCCARG